MMKKSCFFILIIALLLTFTSCKLFGKNPNSGEQGEDYPDDVIYSPETELYLVWNRDEVTDDEVLAIRNCVDYARGKITLITKENSNPNSHEIVIGECDREISKKAYTLLNRIDPETEDNVRYLIYSDGNSIALAFDEALYSSSIAKSSVIEYLLEEIITEKVLSLDAGVVYRDQINVIEHQKSLDNAQEEELWKELSSSLTKEFGAEHAEEIITSARKFTALYSDGIIDWLANLYDPVTGGFYYSNSARDTIGYLPDLESTGQAITWLQSSGASGGKELKDFLQETMQKQVVSFVKGLQDPTNGYFYHPQWGKKLGDDNAARLGRDLNNAEMLLQLFDANPTYDSPNGMKGDGILADGSRVMTTSSVRLTSPLSHGINASAVIAVSDIDAGVPDRLKTEKNFRDYLASLDDDMVSSSYLIGNLLESQSYQFVNRDRVLQSRGETWSVCSILEEWLNSYQNPNTGLFNTSNVVDYGGINGLLKVSSCYNRIGKCIPYAEKAIESALSSLYFDSPENVCWFLNPWYAVEELMENLADYHKNSEELVASVRNRVVADLPELLDITRENISVFSKADGSFSYLPNSSAPTSQNMPVAVRGTNEGDVNASLISTTGVWAGIISVLGYTVPVLYNTSDGMRFLKIVEGLGEIIKDSEPEIVPITFDDDILEKAPDQVSTLINSSGSALVVADPRGEGNVFKLVSYSDGSGKGADKISISCPDNRPSAASYIFESEFCFAEPASNSYVVQMVLDPGCYMLGFKVSEGRVNIWEETAWSSNLSRSVDLGVSAALGEWFKIRIEYYPEDHYGVRIKVYFNDSLIAISDNYASLYGEKLQGISTPSQNFTGISLQVMSNLNCTVMMDNIGLGKSSKRFSNRLGVGENPSINVDPVTPEEKIYNFENYESDDALYSDVTIEKGNDELNVKGDSNKYLSYNNVGGLSYLKFPINVAMVGSNCAVFEANISVTEDTDAGAKLAFNFEENASTLRSVLAFHLVVKEENGQKYVTLANANAYNTSTVIDSVKLPLGDEFTLRIEFYEDDGYSLVYINGKLVASSNNIATKLASPAKVEIKNLSKADTAAEFTLDNVKVEWIYKSFSDATKPGVGRVEHNFESGFGNIIKNGNVEIKNGKVDFSSANTGAEIKIPMNVRNESVNVSRLEAEFNTSGLGYDKEYTVSYVDESENVLLSYKITSYGIYSYISEVTASQEYDPIAKFENGEFKFIIEFCRSANIANIYINGSCVAASGLVYDLNNKKDVAFVVVRAESNAPGIKIDNVVAENVFDVGFERGTPIDPIVPTQKEIIDFEDSTTTTIPDVVIPYISSSLGDIGVFERHNAETEVSKVLRFTLGSGDYLALLPSKSEEEFNTVALEADIRMDSPSGVMEDITLNLRSNVDSTILMRLDLYAYDKDLVHSDAKVPGSIKFRTVEDSGKLTDVSIEGLEEEWFKLRVEYSLTDYNYDTSNNLEKDVIISVFVNDTLIIKRYTPYYTSDPTRWRGVSEGVAFTIETSYSGEIFVDDLLFEEYAVAHVDPAGPKTFEDISSITELPPCISGDITKGGSIVSESVNGAVSKVLAASNGWSNFDAFVFSESYNATAFEADIKLDATEGKQTYRRIYLKDSSGTNAYVFDIVVYDEEYSDKSAAGNLRFRSLDNGGNHRRDIVVLEGLENVWFKLRIEYTLSNKNYDQTNGTKNDCILNIYVNGELVATDHTPVFNTSDATNVSDVNRFYFQNQFDGMYYIDNLLIEKFMMEHPDPDYTQTFDKVSSASSLPSYISGDIKSGGSIVSETINGVTSNALASSNGWSNFDSFVIPESYNATAFEADIKLDATDGKMAYRRIYLRDSAGTNAYVFDIYAYDVAQGSDKAGKLVFRSLDNSGSSRKDLVTLDGLENTWFKLRIEYTLTENDYDTSNATAKDCIFNIYINGQLVVTDHTPVFNTADATNVSDVNRFYFQNAFDGTYYIDNLLIEKFTLDYSVTE